VVGTKKADRHRISLGFSVFMGNLSSTAVEGLRRGDEVDIRNRKYCMIKLSAVETGRKFRHEVISGHLPVAQGHGPLLLRWGIMHVNMFQGYSYVYYSQHSEVLTVVL
jgi:hypothetical protein